MTEIVTVIKDKGKTAVVELTRTEKCAGCDKCAFNRRDTIKVQAIKETACTMGDRVVVTMPEKEIRLAPLFLFVIPILCLLTGILLSRGWPWWGQIVAAAVSLAVGLAVLYAADRLYRRNRACMPVITEKYQNEGEDNHD